MKNFKHWAILITYLLMHTFSSHGMGAWHIWSAQIGRQALRNSDADDEYIRKRDEEIRLKQQQKQQRLAIMRQLRLGRRDKNSTFFSLLPLSVLDNIHLMLKEINESH